MGAEMPENRLIAGRYRLLGPLGEGGMGVVWHARDEALHREVAVKEVRAAGDLPPADLERMYERLAREARAAGRISHRNVVTVFDVVTDDGRPWVVMELVRGLSLDDVLEAEGPLAPARAAAIGAEVLAALEAAHGAGVLHRDVKPGNVLIANDGRVVLSDFGIASVEGSSGLTMTGELVGSPEFLAPERALGRTPGPESDLWSLGVLLYIAVEGVPPFRRGTALGTLRAVADEEPPPPRRAGGLAPVISGLLRKDPSERLPSGAAARLLRLVAAGGGAGLAATARAVPYRTPGAEPEGGAAGGGVTTPDGQGAGGAPVGGERRRRAGAAAVAVLAVLVLAAAVVALVRALDRDGGERGARGTGGGPGTPAVTATVTATAPGDDASDGGGAADGGTDGEEQPAQRVTVAAAAATGHYRGPCPPGPSGGPRFTGVVTVSRLPETVTYRWLVEGGPGGGTGWRDLEFPSGEPGSRTLTADGVVVPREGSGSGRVRLEVRAPAEVRSGWVEFTYECAGGPSGSPAPGSSPGTAEPEADGGSEEGP
jgi:eukaryotic-like serine/threonine-protein kinase